MDKLVEAFVASLMALVDARLIEHGLLVEEAEETPPPKKGAKGGAKAKAAAPAEPEDEEITLDSLKAKITEVVESKGKDAAKDILKKYKVAKLSDLPEAKYVKLDADLTAALADGEESDDDLLG